MKFCKIKLFFLGCLLICLAGPAFAFVQVEELPKQVLEAHGLDKTLPFTSWGNEMPFDVLTQITQDLASQKQSAVLANLTAAVLIQPTFMQPAGWSNVQSEEWLLIRLKALMDLGHTDKTLQIIETIPSDFVSLAILKLKMDAHFILNDWHNACKIALQNTNKDKYFAHTQMLCLGLLGEKDKALMAFDLWQEENANGKTASFVMGQLMDFPVKTPDNFDDITIADIFVLKQLNSAVLDKITLPLSYQKITARTYSGFGTAINATKLLELWEKANLSKEEQSYRFYLLSSYVDLFLPSIRFIRRDILWDFPMTKNNLSLRTMFLKDKPESQITGSDLLLGLWLLSQKSADINNALIILTKGGLHLENYVLEQLNP